MPVAEETRRYVIVTVRKKEKREGLFKILDRPEYADDIVGRTASQRVLTVDLFNELQAYIDSYPRARVSLLRQMSGESDEKIIVANAKPLGDAYNEILRRIRFA